MQLNELPCMRFAVDACNSFMEHQKYHVELEREFDEKYVGIMRRAEKISAYLPWKYSVSFPQIHRQAILIAVAGYLEYLLNEFCEICRVDFCCKNRIDDLKGHKGIFRAFKYLQSEIKMDTSEANEEIEYLTMSARLRNLYVHSGGVMDVKKRRSLHEFLTRVGGASYQDGGVVHIECDYVSRYIATCRAVFIRLEGAIPRNNIN